MPSSFRWVSLNGNKGFEGLAYDAEGKRLFVAKERDPVRIYEIHGFHTQADKPFAVHVVDDPGATSACSSATRPACSSTRAPGTCWRCPTSRVW